MRGGQVNFGDGPRPGGRAGKQALHALLPAAVAVGVLIAAAAAEDASNAAVDQRQKAMKAMAGAAKAIGQMFQGKAAYDAKAFKAAAETIRKQAGDALVVQFPLNSLGDDSQAKPEIWKDWDEFKAIAYRLEAFGTALSAAADKSPNAITDEMRMPPGMVMGGTLLGARNSSPADPKDMPAEHAFHLMLQDCTSCHAKFRTKQNAKE